MLRRRRRGRERIKRGDETWRPPLDCAPGYGGGTAWRASDLGRREPAPGGRGSPEGEKGKGEKPLGIRLNVEMGGGKDALTVTPRLPPRSNRGERGGRSALTA